MPTSRNGLLSRKEHAAGHAAFEAKVDTAFRDLKRYFREDVLVEVRKAAALAGAAKACADEVRGSNADFKFRVMEQWDALVTKWSEAWTQQQTDLIWKMALYSVGGGLGLLLGALALLKAFGLLKV